MFKLIRRYVIFCFNVLFSCSDLKGSGEQDRNVFKNGWSN